MARLNEARRSKVVTVSEWPRDARSRGVGWVHDQVWFPVSDEYRWDSEMRRIDGSWYALYLDRKMFWFGWTLRFHTFYMGDEDSAPHDHPWWFVTFPLVSYWETVEELIPSPLHWYDWRKRRPADHPMYWRRRASKVRAFLPHFRRAKHRHFVHEGEKPIRTIVLTGRVARTWGFWPRNHMFVTYKRWADYRKRKMP